MQRPIRNLILAVVCLCAVAPPSHAELWCASLASDPSVAQTIVCDGFDGYCVDAPAWPEACPVGSTPDQVPFDNNWPEVTPGINPMRVRADYAADGHPLYAESWPFTARYYSGSNPDAGNFYYDVQRSRDLQSNIAALAPGRNIVNGTDEHPLILTFVYNFHDSGRQYYQSQYVDLSLNDGTTLDRAPTDYVPSEDCSQGYSCGDMHEYPIICQQNDFAASSIWGCPPLSSLPVHSSIAAGILSWLDTNPCHCEEQVAHAAQNWHLTVFDGKEWWTMKSNLFPGGGTRTPVEDAPEPPPQECNIKSPGDFGLANVRNFVKLTIKTSTIRVDHWYRQKCKTDNTKRYDIAHWAEVPRRYLGGFNNIALGTAQGCELNTNGECVGKRHALGPNGHGGNAEMDSVALLNGVLGTFTSVGACCQSDGTCVEADQTACVSILHGRYAGPDTTCATTLCCPLPFADVDHDGDVDHTDFGAWQVCFANSGGVPTGCECFDRNADGKVDAADFNEFNNCFTGANVPWNQALTPSCSP